MTLWYLWTWGLWARPSRPRSRKERTGQDWPG